MILTESLPTSLMRGPNISAWPSFSHSNERGTCSLVSLDDDDDDEGERSGSLKETSGCKITSSPSLPRIAGPFLITTVITPDVEITVQFWLKCKSRKRERDRTKSCYSEFLDVRC